MPSKRVAFFADLHSGHRAGLTPPEWYGKLGVPTQEREELALLWDWLMSRVKYWGPFDITFWNGDLIDGRGSITGGIEQFTTDRIVQAQIAASAINTIGGDLRYATYGTRYHTSSDGEELEDITASIAGIENIEGHGFYNINGCIIDMKHYAGTVLKGQRIWNIQWSLDGQAPLANVIIRSHVHTFEYVGGDNWIAISTPALQGWGSRYGVKQCSRVVHFGFIVMDIEEDGTFVWQPEIYKGKAQRVTPLVL